MVPGSALPLVFAYMRTRVNYVYGELFFVREQSFIDFKDIKWLFGKVRSHANDISYPL